MANDKKNINELVNDDDPTAELEVLVLPVLRVDTCLESASGTAGYAKQTKTAERSQKLNTELKRAKQVARQKKTLVAERDDEIRLLKCEIELRTKVDRKLPAELATLNQRVTVGDAENTENRDNILAVQAGQLASDGLQIHELQARISKIEEYADHLRELLRVRDDRANELDLSTHTLQHRLQVATTQLEGQQIELSEAKEENANLNSSISTLQGTHAEEIRIIRFELGDAQEMLSQQESVAEQLTSDLAQTRGYRKKLENLLVASEEISHSEIEKLEKENRQLLQDSERMREKLHTKSKAITSLLAEVAKVTEQSDANDDTGETIQEVDGRMSEIVDDGTHAERDRVTRVLTGTIDSQELRFPLFKDRLTIGRARQNDIQLNSEHISRRHAVVVIEGGVTRIIDWGSKNGIFVNFKRVKEHFLKNNDVVSVGAAEFRYEERAKRDR
jgi:chromosome segregation ATPase